PARVPRALGRPVAVAASSRRGVCGPRSGLSTRTAPNGHGNCNKSVTFRPRDTSLRDQTAPERPSTRLPPMRILVTGGAGFVGSNFVCFWLARPPADDVVVLHLLTYAGHRASLDDVHDRPFRRAADRGDRQLAARRLP